MTHARASAQLSAYLDGELDPSEVRAVEAHLAGCAICREDLAALRQVKRWLGRLPEVEPSEAVWQSLRRRITAEEHRPAPAGALLDTVRAAFRRPAVAAVAAVLVVLLVAIPLVKGRIDRLQAADIGVDLYVREHVLLSASDPFVDRAYLGLLVGDANLALAGARRLMKEQP